jgi:hypothetical protein
MNIDISELLALDTTAVNQIAKQYDLPHSIAALHAYYSIRKRL